MLKAELKSALAQLELCLHNLFLLQHNVHVHQFADCYQMQRRRIIGWGVLPLCSGQLMFNDYCPDHSTGHGKTPLHKCMLCSAAYCAVTWRCMAATGQCAACNRPADSPPTRACAGAQGGILLLQRSGFLAQACHLLVLRPGDLVSQSTYPTTWTSAKPCVKLQTLYSNFTQGFAEVLFVGTTDSAVNPTAACP